MLICYAPSWIAVAPPYTSREAEIDEMVARLCRSIVEVLGEFAG